MKAFLVAVIVALASLSAHHPALADYTKTLKEIPSEFVGEWCFSDADDSRTDYKLPSWSEKGACDDHAKLLSVSLTSFDIDNIYYAPITKILSKEECAPSGCDYSAEFSAHCRSNDPKPSWITKTKLDRYKGNLTVKIGSNNLPPRVEQPFPQAPACFAVSDDGFVNVHETPNGPLIGPIPTGRPLNVLGKHPSNSQWSRIQTPFLARVGRTGVVATYLIQCN